MKIAIIGAGGIADRHVDILLGLDAPITAVIDTNPGRAEQLASRAGARVYSSIEEALPNFDAAYVLTPPGSRVEIIRTLARSGKAIFSEKPLAASLADATAIVDVIESTGVPFMMGFMRRWHPPYAHLKSLIEDGTIGKPLQIFRQRLGYLPMASGNWRIDAKQLCGLTVESVSHDIDLFRWLGGEIVSATGVISESRNDLPGFDDTMAATLRFENGATGVLQVSWASLVQQNQCGIFGTVAAAVLSGRGMWSSEHLDERVGTDAVETRTVIAPEQATDDGYAGENAAFLELIAGNEVAYPSVRDGLRTVEISHEIISSSSP